MFSDKPKVTVLMPVYNGEKHLSEAIDSILQQTFTDFDFLIIDDGSNDQSVSIIERYKDKRILLLRNNRNRGLVETLNKGLDIAKGQYIARMDCDDISYPERLQKQVDFMDKHPDIGVCGTWAELFGEKHGEVWKYPINHDEIKCSLIFNSVLVHPSVIIRKSIFRGYNLYYDPTYIYAEDFELWQRCTQRFLVANIPEVLLKYRITSSSTSRLNKEKQKESLRLIHEKNIKRLKITLKESDYAIHRAISTYNVEKDQDFIIKTNIWLIKLKRANDLLRIFPNPTFSQLLANRLFWICYNVNTLGLWVWKTYWQSSLSRYNTITCKEKVKFIINTFVFQWNFLSTLMYKFNRSVRNNKNYRL